MKMTNVIMLLVSFLSALFLLAHQVGASVNDWQKSASMVPQSSSDFSSTSFQNSVKQFQATGGNQIVLIIPIYQSNEYATDLHAGWNTPTDSSLISATKFIRSLNMKVTYKIHAENENGRWRAYINPSDRTKWFTSYGNWITHYGQLAQQHNVEEFVVGAELYNMTSQYTNSTNTQNWISLIDNLRKIYSGKVTYSAQRTDTNNWYSEMSEIGFWNKLDYLGISAYYPMAPSVNNPTVNDYVSSWQAAVNQFLYPLYQKYQIPMLLTEIGYRSIDNANKEPYSYDYAGAPNMQTQADLFEALFQFWNNQSWMNGIMLWDWSTNPNAGGPSDQGYTPQNKTAIQTISNWFGGSGPQPSPTPTPTPSPSPTPTPGSQAFTITASNQAATVTVQVAANNPIADAIVDIEIYNSSNQQQKQVFYEHQNLSTNAKIYTVTHAITTPGTYRIAVGIFNANWSSLLVWQNEAGAFVVGSSPTPTPSPTATPTPSPMVSPAPTPMPTATPLPASNELLTSPWTFAANGGSSERYQSISPSILQGKTSLTLTYNLHGACLLSGDASAIIFDQGGQWRFVSLANYGQNCKAGEQTVTIPLSDFGGLYTSQSVGQFHARFWLPSAYSITISSAKVNSGSITPTPSPTISPAPTPTPTIAPSPTPNPTNAVLNIWWPTNGATVGGVQPFKVQVSSMNLSDYDMHWQVDDGSLNNMSDSQVDGPHKEFLVDVSLWNWKGSGPYTVTFIAKSKSGQELVRQSIAVMVSH